MNKVGEKSTVCTKRSSDVILKEDKLSALPDSLLFEVLLKLTTKEVTKTSVLSKRWAKLWRFVPGLDMNYCDFRDKDSFPDYTAFVVFIEIFLAFNSRPYLQKLKLVCHHDAHYYYLNRWIDTAIKRKVQHLDVFEGAGYKVKIPPTIYTCESLVSLKLSLVTLPSPEFVSLPSLKDIHLERVKFANDDPNVLRDFLVAITRVKHMVICLHTLEVMYGYSPYEPLPLFHNLSFLCIKTPYYNYWDMNTPVIFLENCPNLKSLVLEGCTWVFQSDDSLRLLFDDSLSDSLVPQCLKSSLEYVEIKAPSLCEAMEMKLVSYCLKNSKILKKLTLCLNRSRKNKASDILKKIRTIPRLSTSCNIIVL